MGRVPRGVLMERRVDGLAMITFLDRAGKEGNAKRSKCMFGRAWEA